MRQRCGQESAPVTALQKAAGTLKWSDLRSRWYIARTPSSVSPPAPATL